VLVTPLMVISAREADAVGWIPSPHLWELKVLFHDYFGPVDPVALILFGCAVAAVLPPRARWRWLGGAGVKGGQRPPLPWWRAGGVSLPSVAAPLLVVPGSLLLLESLVARPLYVDRYVLYGEAGAALLAGAGAYRIGKWLAAASGRRELAWLTGLALCVSVLAFQLGPQHRVRTPQARLFDFGGPSRYVAAHARPGDGVLYFTTFYRKAELGYPGDFRNVSDFSLAVSPARTGTFQGLDKPFAVTEKLMLARHRIWVLGRPPSAPLPAGETREESTALKQNFTLVDEQHFRGIVVTLWVRR
jgi:mannosyltransferase